MPRRCRCIPDDAVPLVGRPADLPFSGASRHPSPSVQARSTAFPSVSTLPPRLRLEAQTPLTLSVTITALAAVRRPPVRIDLREVPAFDRAFFIEDMTDGKKEQIAPSAWRWFYRLKPRSARVDEIPGLPFVFYNPDLLPAEKAFQVIWTDAIPLTVEPAEPLSAPLDLPESMLELADGPGVLAERRPWRMPGPVVLAMLLVGPPLICLCWYRLWRRWYPDAARAAQVRRSSSARRALTALDSAQAESGSVRGDRVAGAVATYLRERFDRAPAEPTPTEATALLLAHGYPAELADNAGRLLHACAAVRFPPVPMEEADLLERSLPHSCRGGSGMILSLVIAIGLLAPGESDSAAELARKAEDAFDEGLRRRLAGNARASSFAPLSPAIRNCGSVARTIVCSIATWAMPACWPATCPAPSSPIGWGYGSRQETEFCAKTWLRPVSASPFATVACWADRRRTIACRWLAPAGCSPLPCWATSAAAPPSRAGGCCATGQCSWRER